MAELSLPNLGLGFKRLSVWSHLFPLVHGGDIYSNSAQTLFLGYSSKPRLPAIQPGNSTPCQVPHLNTAHISVHPIFTITWEARTSTTPILQIKMSKLGDYKMCTKSQGYRAEAQPEPGQSDYSPYSQQWVSEQKLTNKQSFEKGSKSPLRSLQMFF